MSTFTEATAQAWLTALTFIAPAISSRPASPALANVHIDTLTGTLTGSNYEVTANADLTDWISDGKPFLAPYRALVDAIKKTTKADRKAPVRVEAHTEDGQRFITLKAAGYTLVLPAADIGEWPKLSRTKATSNIVVTGRALKAAAQRVGMAASKDDTIPLLQAIRFEHMGGVLTLTATDRYRLAMSKIPTMARVRTPSTFLLKARFVAEIARRTTAGDTVRLEVLNGGAAIRANLPGGALSSLTTDGKYPEIETLFPDHLHHSFTVERAPLLAAARVAAGMTERNTPVQLDFTSSGAILTFNHGLFDGSTSPLIAGASSGETYEPRTVALNPQYLVEAITATTGNTVQFGFTTIAKPVQITDGTTPGAQPAHRHIIMPVRMPTRIAP